MSKFSDPWRAVKLHRPDRMLLFIEARVHQDAGEPEYLEHCVPMDGWPVDARDVEELQKHLIEAVLRYLSGRHKRHGTKH